MSHLLRCTKNETLGRGQSLSNVNQLIRDRDYSHFANGKLRLKESDPPEVIDG